MKISCGYGVVVVNFRLIIFYVIFFVNILTPIKAFSQEESFPLTPEFKKLNDIPEGDERKNIKIVDPLKLPIYKTIQVKQEDLPPPGPPPRMEIIVDSSGSMGQLLNSDRTKMYYLKKIMARFFSEQWKGVNENALRVYGSRVKNDCEDTYLAVPNGLKSLTDIEQKVRGLYPIGRTPIYATIKNAINHIKTYKGPKRVVIFTDGEETCGGDPCKLTKETLLAKTMDIKFYVVAIGFPPGKDSLKKVNCIGDTTLANNENEIFNALGNIASENVLKNNNLKVISPDPSSYVQLFKINKEGKPEFFKIFTSSFGTQVPPGDYEAVVMIEPNYRFPRFTIPPKKRVVLHVFGEGQVLVKFVDQLLDVEMLDKNLKVIKSFTSDQPTMVPAGRYKMRLFRDPFFVKMVQPVHVFPDGRYEYEASEAGVVQFDFPQISGFYVYDSSEKLLGNFLTNFPMVLPRGDYRFHMHDKCSYDHVRVDSNFKVNHVDCEKLRLIKVRRSITERKLNLEEYKEELKERLRKIEAHKLDPSEPLPPDDPLLEGGSGEEMLHFIEGGLEKEKLEKEKIETERLEKEKLEKEKLEKEKKEKEAKQDEN